MEKQKRLSYKALLLVAFSFLFLFLPLPVHALTSIPSGGNAGFGCEIQNGSVVSLGCLIYPVQNIIEVALAFLGAVAVIFFLWGSAQVILSQGDAKALQKARGTITFAIVGAVIILCAFLIISLVTSTFNLPDIIHNFTFYQQ